MCRHVCRHVCKNVCRYIQTCVGLLLILLPCGVPTPVLHICVRAAMMTPPPMARRESGHGAAQRCTARHGAAQRVWQGMVPYSAARRTIPRCLKPWREYRVLAQRHKRAQRPGPGRPAGRGDGGLAFDAMEPCNELIRRAFVLALAGPSRERSARKSTCISTCKGSWVPTRMPARMSAHVSTHIVAPLAELIFELVVLDNHGLLQ